jgi:NTE family protein
MCYGAKGSRSIPYPPLQNHAAVIIPVIPRFKEHIHLFDTDKIPYIVEEGERATEEQLPELRRLLESHA